MGSGTSGAGTGARSNSSSFCASFWMTAGFLSICMSPPDCLSRLCDGLGGGLLLPELSHRLDRLDHFCITRTPAQVAGQCVADVVLARIRVFIEQRLRRHDHARSAEPALQRTLLFEQLLQRVQLLL